MTPAGCHIGQVGAEILATRLAIVLRVGDVKFLGSPRNQVADIEYGTRVHPVTRCRFLATGAGSLNLIAVFFDNLGFGQVFNPCERGIGDILAGTQFG
jgi:hypothetical protein